MGAILADCLDGLPLMRELNLRDNRLSDKGLMPIVKVRVPLLARKPPNCSAPSLICRGDDQDFSILTGTGEQA